MTASVAQNFKIPAVNAQDHMRGPNTGAITLIAYGDYQCHGTQQAATVIEKLQRQWDGRIRFVYRHFPQDELHRQAFLAAEAAEAAAAQGKFWEMHALLLERAAEIDDDNLKRWAQRLRLDADRFMLDLSDSRYAGRVYESYQAACRAGISETPALFINGRLYEGALNLASLALAVQHEWYGARQVPIMRSSRFDVPYISPAVIREIQKIAG